MTEKCVEVGVYRAESINVVEVAKVIENSQRNINITFLNELSIIFNKMGIVTKSFFAVAGTKWNLYAGNSKAVDIIKKIHEHNNPRGRTFWKKKGEKKLMRLLSIDVFKGFGILLMVIGHIVFNDVVLQMIYSFIYSFHMPLFYLVSGYLLNAEKIERDILPYLKKQGKSLLIPYFSFGLFYVLIMTIAWVLSSRPTNGEINLSSMIYHFLWTNNVGLGMAYAMWFLTSLFWVKCIFSFIYKFCYKWLTLISGLLFFCGLIFAEKLRYLPWGLDTAIIGIGFYYIGYKLKIWNRLNSHNNISINVQRPSVLCVAFIVVCFSIFQNGRVDMHEGIYNNILLFIFNSTSMCLVLYNIIKLLLPHNCNSYLVLYLKHLGDNAITYVCLQGLTIYFCMKFVKKIIPTAVPFFLTHFVVLCLVLFVLYIVNAVIVNSKLKVFLGKGK